MLRRLLRSRVPDRIEPLDLPAPDITGQIHSVSNQPTQANDVYTGTWNGPSGAIKVVLKVVRVNSDQDEQLLAVLKRRVYVWQKLQHPNVVPIYGLSFSIARSPAIVASWCKHGNICGYLRTHADTPGIEGLEMKLLIDALEGLKYLHANNIVHGDLKGRNVLISNERVAQLSNFGLSETDHSLKSSHNIASDESYRWKAPELLLADVPKLTFESDVWGYGCLMAEVLSGRVPYRNRQTVKEVVSAMNKSETPFPSAKGTDLRWILILACCNMEPGQRPSVSYVLERLQILHLVHVVPAESDFVPLRGGISALLGSLERCILPVITVPDPYVLAVLYAWTQSSTSNYAADDDLTRKIDHLLDLFGDIAHKSISGDAHYANSTGEDALHSVVMVFFDWVKLFTFSTSPVHRPQRILALIELCERHDSKTAILLRSLFRCNGTVDITASQGVGTLSWEPRGQRLLVTSHDSDSMVLNVVTSYTVKIVAKADFPSTYPPDRTSVVISPSGKLVLFTAAGTLGVWDVDSRNVIVRHDQLMEPGSHTLSFSPDSKSVLDVCSSGWSVRHATTLEKIIEEPFPDQSPAHGNPLEASLVMQDKSVVCICFAHAVKRLHWDLKTDPCLHCVHWKRHLEYSVSDVAFYPDGRRIVVASGTMVFVWDMRKGDTISEFGHDGSVVLSVACSPDGTLIASGSSTGTVSVWDAQEYTLLASFDTTQGFIKNLAFSPDSRALACVTRNLLIGPAQVSIWDVKYVSTSYSTSSRNPHATPLVVLAELEV